MTLQTRPLAYALGAEITGINIRKPLDGETVREIHSAFLEHCVLLFRRQPLTRAQHIAFTRHFGEVDTNETKVHRDTEYPEIVMKRAGAGKPSYASNWHSDRCFTCVPPAASLLRGVEIPDVGGDTMFANMYLAYETLSDGMKKLIESVHAINIGGTKSRIDHSTPEREAETRRQHTVAQPLVRVHPETGRKALFVCDYTKQLVGMTLEESKPLIQFLCQHATRPQFVYRHQWQNDDLVMWDNRCTLHNALHDFDKTKIRQVERTQTNGTPSGYLYEVGLQK